MTLLRLVAQVPVPVAEAQKNKNLFWANDILCWEPSFLQRCEKIKNIKFDTATSATAKISQGQKLISCAKIYNFKIACTATVVFLPFATWVLLRAKHILHFSYPEADSLSRAMTLHQRIQKTPGLQAPRPPLPPRFFKIVQFSGNCSGKTPVLSTFWDQAPLWGQNSPAPRPKCWICPWTEAAKLHRIKH